MIKNGGNFVKEIKMEAWKKLKKEILVINNKNCWVVSGNDQFLKYLYNYYNNKNKMN